VIYGITVIVTGVLIVETKDGYERKNSSATTLQRHADEVELIDEVDDVDPYDTVEIEYL